MPTVIVIFELQYSYSVESSCILLSDTSNYLSDIHCVIRFLTFVKNPQLVLYHFDSEQEIDDRKYSTFVMNSSFGIVGRCVL